jgi:hypothetical protein
MLPPRTSSLQLMQDCKERVHALNTSSEICNYIKVIRVQPKQRTVVNSRLYIYELPINLHGQLLMCATVLDCR